MSLTYDLRQQIRAALAERARLQRQREIQAHNLPTCAKCGCDLDHRTAGCKTCSDRWRKRARRQDPEWRRKENLADRYRRHLKRRRRLDEQTA